MWGIAPTTKRFRTGSPLRVAARILLVLAGCCSLAPLIPQAPVHAGRHLAPRQAAAGDDAVYAGDVSVPDHTVFSPGQHFVKTWRIRNIGRHAWSSGYHWHFEAGTQMSALTEVPVGYTSPGATVDISVPMTAPTATGVYTSFWQMTDAGGLIFGHQAWVSIIVRKGGAPAIASPTAAATRQATVRFPTAIPPTATVRPTPAHILVPTHVPTHTAVPTATPRPIAPRPIATPAPTIVMPGGDGRTVASPWTGALAYRSYFAAGSTAHGMDETLSLYYPGPGIAHVQLTMYRPDAAHRVLLLTLPAGRRTTLPLSRIAPNTPLALAVEADRRVIASRVQTAGRSALGNPGAPRTARYWWFPGAAFDGVDQQLVFFNPHDEPARVSLSIGSAQGGCCARTGTVTVPPLRQYVADLGTDARLSGPLSLSATSVVAVERIFVAPDWSAVAGLPGTATPASTWYLPDMRTGANGSSVLIFNPSFAPTTATITLALTEGPGRALKETIPPFSQIEVPIGGLALSPIVGAIVQASRPIVAGGVVPANSDQPAIYIGSPAASASWAVVASAGGRGTSQTVTALNPNARSCSVTFTIVGDRARGGTWQVTVPPGGQIARIVDGLLPANGGIIQIQASAPVVVGRTLESRTGLATSTGTVISS